MPLHPSPGNPPLHRLVVLSPTAPNVIPCKFPDELPRDSSPPPLLVGLTFSPSGRYFLGLELDLASSIRSVMEEAGSILTPLRSWMTSMHVAWVSNTANATGVWSLPSRESLHPSYPGTVRNSRGAAVRPRLHRVRLRAASRRTSASLSIPTRSIHPSLRVHWTRGVKPQWTRVGSGSIGRRKGGRTGTDRVRKGWRDGGKGKGGGRGFVPIEGSILCLGGNGQGNAQANGNVTRRGGGSKPGGPLRGMEERDATGADNAVERRGSPVKRWARPLRGTEAAPPFVEGTLAQVQIPRPARTTRPRIAPDPPPASLDRIRTAYEDVPSAKMWRIRPRGDPSSERIGFKVAWE
eukprot:scaffold408_cov347-Pavlova_lutheri.AAC.44